MSKAFIFAWSHSLTYSPSPPLGQNFDKWIHVWKSSSLFANRLLADNWNRVFISVKFWNYCVPVLPPQKQIQLLWRLFFCFSKLNCLLDFLSRKVLQMDSSMQSLWQFMPGSTAVYRKLKIQSFNYSCFSTAATKWNTVAIKYLSFYQVFFQQERMALGKWCIGPQKVTLGIPGWNFLVQCPGLIFLAARWIGPAASTSIFSVYLDYILRVCQSLWDWFLYLGKLHWFLYLLLSYFYDPGMFIFMFLFININCELVAAKEFRD